MMHRFTALAKFLIALVAFTSLQFSALSATAAGDLPVIGGLTAVQIEVGGFTQKVDMSWRVDSGTFIEGDQFLVEKSSDSKATWSTIATLDNVTSYSVSVTELRDEILYDLAISVVRKTGEKIRYVAQRIGASDARGIDGGCYQLSDFSNRCWNSSTRKYEVATSEISGLPIENQEGNCAVVTGNVICTNLSKYGLGESNQHVRFSPLSTYSYVLDNNFLWGEYPKISNVIQISGSCALTSEGQIYCWYLSKYASLVKWPNFATSMSSSGTSICAMDSSNTLTCRRNGTFTTRSNQPSMCAANFAASTACIDQTYLVPAKVSSWLELPAVFAPNEVLQIMGPQSHPCVVSKLNKYACVDSSGNVYDGTLPNLKAVSSYGRLFMNSENDIFRRGDFGSFIPVHSSAHILVVLPNQSNLGLAKGSISGAVFAEQTLTFNHLAEAGKTYEYGWYLDGAGLLSTNNSVFLPAGSDSKWIVFVAKAYSPGKATEIRQNSYLIAPTPVLSNFISGNTTLGAPLKANISAPNCKINGVEWRVQGSPRVLSRNVDFVAPYDASGKQVTATWSITDASNNVLTSTSSVLLDSWQVPEVQQTGTLINGTSLTAAIGSSPYPYQISWLSYNGSTKVMDAIPGQTGNSFKIEIPSDGTLLSNILVRFTFAMPNGVDVVIERIWEGTVVRPTIQSDPPTLSVDGVLEPGHAVTCTHQIVQGAQYGYQWVVGNVWVENTNKSVYWVRSQDVGKEISCIYRAVKELHEDFQASSAKMLVLTPPSATRIKWGAAFDKSYEPNSKATFTATLEDLGAGFPDTVRYRTKSGTGAWSGYKSAVVNFGVFSFASTLTKDLTVEVTFDDSRDTRTYKKVVRVAPKLTASWGGFNKVSVGGFKQGGKIILNVKASSWYKATCVAVATTARGYTGKGLPVGRSTGISKTIKLNGSARIEVPVKYNGDYSWSVSCTMPGYAKVTYNDTFGLIVG